MGKCRRRVNTRELPPKVYLYSEDAVTAPLYLRSLFRSKSNVKLELVKSGTTPKNLFRDAKVKNKQIPISHDNDVIWLLFDRDDHDEVDRIVSECSGTDIVLGYSNPCFELWLLYHYQDHDAPDDRNRLKSKLKTVCQNYCGQTEKLTGVDELLPLLEHAIRRANASLVAREAEGTPNGRPSSTMGAIVESLNGFT